MPSDITVFSNGVEIGQHNNSDFDSTDIGADVPGPCFTQIVTPDAVVEYWGDVTVKVVRTKKEGE